MEWVVWSGDYKGCILLPCYVKDKEIQFFAHAFPLDKETEILNFAKALYFKAEQEELCSFLYEGKFFLLAGLKELYSSEDVRRVYSCAFAFLKKKKILEFSLFVPSEGKETVRAIVDGMELSDYSFQKYRKAEAEDSEHILSCFLHVSSQLTSDLAVWTLIARQTKYARDLINANASELYPEVLVGELSSFCEKENLEYEVLDEKELEKERMNLLLAVGSGSVHPPRLALASYRGNPDSDEYVALVGKGITFDTGGVNLKPTGYVEAMKCDMAGAAVALSVFQAAVKLTFRCNLVLVLSSAENALSGSSYLPGDVLRARSGLGVEILNTDAEGRLVLADAFDYVQEKWKVKILVDLATLTGACLVALGPKLIALLGNDVALKKALFDAGETVYEQTWELPIYEEHQEAIKGTFGNIKNQGGKYGGVSTAAAFLQAFVRDGVSWAHLDIAGAAYSEKAENYWPQAGTGRGVRLLLEWLKDV
ncbi:MAG: leucyl aminopeptidase family protein [Candidatus Woesearchaeota archaeon]|nr:MAG: leucyl aminopeptidase family protein [Candidatus Woesearchaeota archaeon]